MRYFGGASLIVKVMGQIHILALKILCYLVACFFIAHRQKRMKVYQEVYIIIQEIINLNLLIYET